MSIRKVIVGEASEIKELDNFLTNNKVWICDLETSGLEPYNGDSILGISITAEIGRAHV